MMSLEAKSADFSLFGDIGYKNGVNLLTIYYHLTTHDRSNRRISSKLNVYTNRNGLFM